MQRSENVGTKEFVNRSKKLIVDYINDNRDVADSKEMTVDDVYVVWISKVLQNNKALLSTTSSDGMYYEITHNGDKDEIYLDAYKKWENIAYKI